MAGNFVPRLPTWNTTVINWIFDPLTGTRSLGSGFSAQMYPPFRTSDNPGPSDGYLVFPKSVTEIHDPTEYNNAGMDAVVFNWQGNDFGWKVIQLLPRWMNFPNEHWLALLQRMTAAELADIANPGNALYPVNVAAWLRDSGAGTWPTSAAIAANIVYPQLTAAPGTMFGDLYMLYPSSSNILRDKAEFNKDVFDYGFPDADVVIIEQPSASGNMVAYQVLQVHPRELGQVGEHLAARLARLTTTQAGLFHGTPDAGTSTITATPTTVADDGVATTTISGQMLDAASNPVIGATVVISSSGSATIASSPTTDASGNWSTTATDTTAETVTFSADCLGVTVGPSPAVTFANPPYLPNCWGRWDEASVPADGVTPAHFRVHIEDAFGNPIAGLLAGATSGSSGTVVYTPDPPFANTDASGETVIAVTDTVIETVSQQGYFVGWDGSPNFITPADTVDFT